MTPAARARSAGTEETAVAVRGAEKAEAEKMVVRVVVVRVEARVVVVRVEARWRW